LIGDCDAEDLLVVYFVWHTEKHCESVASYAAKIINSVTSPLLQHTAMLPTGHSHITLSPVKIHHYYY